MRQQQQAVFALAGMMAVLWPVSLRAADTCTATVKAKDGTIQVSAKHVSGTLKWGWTPTTQIQPFFNAATCIKASGSAVGCTQGGTGTLLATTPPPDCLLQLTDDSSSCTAYVKKCIPGKRPAVEFPVRFVDNGDGTVIDTRTWLMWEQKTDDGSIHDKDNTYTWTAGSPYNPDGTAFFTFLATLNGLAPFAGYDDWRLPTITELQTIVDLTQENCGGGTPCIDETLFGPTFAGWYWSATTSDIGASHAKALYFFSGNVGDILKTSAITGHARAVRSGL